MLEAVAALGSHCREGYSNGAEARGLPDLADVRSVVVLRHGRIRGRRRRPAIGVPRSARCAGRGESVAGAAGARGPALPRGRLVLLGEHVGNARGVPRIHEARLPGDRGELRRDDRGRGGRGRRARRARARRLPAARRAGLARVHRARRAGSRRPPATAGRRRRRGGGRSGRAGRGVRARRAHRRQSGESDWRRRSASGSP